jgi:hypothetical protein
MMSVILPEMLTETQRSARESKASWVASIGEPWITYFDPISLAPDVAAPNNEKRLHPPP